MSSHTQHRSGKDQSNKRVHETSLQESRRIKFNDTRDSKVTVSPESRCIEITSGLLRNIFFRRTKARRRQTSVHGWWRTCCRVRQLINRPPSIRSWRERRWLPHSYKIFIEYKGCVIIRRIRAVRTYAYTHTLTCHTRYETAPTCYNMVRSSSQTACVASTWTRL